MKRLIVPVVLKESIYERVVPRKSYIAADQFQSPEELAAYLQYLVANHTAYAEYVTNVIPRLKLL